MQQGAADQAKSPEAFRTISEVADDLDVPQHVLRFWESRFSQIKPVKRAGARRYYRPEDVDLIRGIRALLYTEGFTIKGAQKILRDKGVRHVAELGRGEASAKGAGTKRAKSGRPKKDETYRELRAVDFSEESLPQELEAAWDAGEAAPEVVVEKQSARAKAKSRQPNLFADSSDTSLEGKAEVEADIGIKGSPAQDDQIAALDEDRIVAREPLSAQKRARLESLLAELLSLKVQLRAARGNSV